MAETAGIALPTNVVDLASHESFWWLYQTQPSAVALLSEPENVKILIAVVCGLGHEKYPAVRDLPSSTVGDMPANKGPYHYVNPNPGQYVSTYLVCKGEDSGSTGHHDLFCACQALLTPASMQVLANTDELLDIVFEFATGKAADAALSTVRAGYFTNVVSQLAAHDPDRFAEYLSRPTGAADQEPLAKLVATAQLIGNDSVGRLFCRILTGSFVRTLFCDRGADVGQWLLDVMCTLVSDAEAGRCSVESGQDRVRSTCAVSLTALKCWSVRPSGGEAADGSPVLPLPEMLPALLFEAWHSQQAWDCIAKLLHADIEGDGAGLFPEVGLKLLRGLLESVPRRQQAENSQRTADASLLAGLRATSPLRDGLREELGTPTIADLLRDGSGVLGTVALGNRPAAPRAGAVRYAAADLLRALCAEGTAEDVVLAGTKSGCWAAATGAMFAFPTANLLHSAVTQAFLAVLRRVRAGEVLPEAASALMHGRPGTTDAGLLAALAAAWREREAGAFPVAAEYFGHVEMLALEISEAVEKPVRELLGRYPALLTMRTVAGESVLHVAARKARLGLVRMLLAKADAQLLAAIDKAGKTAADVCLASTDEAVACRQALAGAVGPASAGRGWSPPNSPPKSRPPISPPRPVRPTGAGPPPQLSALPGRPLPVPVARRPLPTPPSTGGGGGGNGLSASGDAPMSPPRGVLKALKPLPLAGPTSKLVPLKPLALGGTALPADRSFDLPRPKPAAPEGGKSKPRVATPPLPASLDVAGAGDADPDAAEDENEDETSGLLGPVGAAAAVAEAVAAVAGGGGAAATVAVDGEEEPLRKSRACTLL